MMYDRFDSMTSQELDAEIHRLTNLFFKQRPGTKMYQQLVLAINQARQVAGDKHQHQALQEKFKDPENQGIIDIGDIEEKVYTPDYSKEELVIMVASSYKSGDRNESK
jgi:hypothetical protein